METLSWESVVWTPLFSAHSEFDFEHEEIFQLLGNTRLSFCWPTSCCLCIWSVINRLKGNLFIWSWNWTTKVNSFRRVVHCFSRLLQRATGPSFPWSFILDSRIYFPPKRYCIFYETERSNFEMALLVWRLIFASFEVQSKFSGGFKRM